MTEKAFMPVLSNVLAASMSAHLIFRAGNFVPRSFSNSSIFMLFLFSISVLMSSGVCSVKVLPILKARMVRAEREAGVSTSRNPSAASLVVVSLLPCCLKNVSSERRTMMYFPDVKHLTWGISVMVKNVVPISWGSGVV